jgi:hypothetical protein
MRHIRTVTIVSIALFLISVAPLAAAQGGRGPMRSPVTIEFTKPEMAVKNKTVELDKTGMAMATFKVGYRASNTCQPGTKFDVPLTVDPKTLPPGMTFTIKPDHAIFDISASAPTVPPSMMGGTTKYSENHELMVMMPVANLTSWMKAPINVTTGDAKTTGGQCAPSGMGGTPSTSGPTLRMPGVATLNVTFTPAKKAAAVQTQPAKSPGADLLTILVLVAGVAFARGRSKS